MSLDLTDVDAAASWRAEIITDFRLRGDERCAAASPIPGFPQILESLVAEVSAFVGEMWVDLGGSLGGAASWIHRRLDQRVTLVDSTVSNLRAAGLLFAELSCTCALVHALPVRDEAAAVAISNGAMSQRDDVDAFLAEAARILVPAGRLAIADLWVSRDHHVDVQSMTLRTIEEFGDRAASYGFAIAHIAVADREVGWWSSAAEQVADEIDLRYGQHPAYAAWRRKQDELGAALRNDEVFAAGLVLVREDGVAVDGL